MRIGPIEVAQTRPGDDRSDLTVTRSYIIATLPRSGSWLLADGLRSTGVAGRPSEYFRPDYVRELSEAWSLPAGTPVRQLIPAAQRASATDNGVFGCKLHRYQLDWLLSSLREDGEAADDASLLGDVMPGLRFVYLTRGDKAAQALSYYEAERTQQWFELTGEAEPGRATEPVDLPRVRWFEEILERDEAAWRDFFTRCRVDRLEVTYEELSADYRGTIARVLGFLDLDPAAAGALPEPRLAKQAGEVAAAWLTAYRSVRPHLFPNSPSAEPPERLAWVARCLLAGVPREQIVGLLAERGGAEQLVARVEADPVLGVAREWQWQATRKDALLRVSQDLSQLSDRAATIEWREDLGAGEFAEDFYSANRPVLLEGVAREWPARSWTPGLLRERCGDIEVEVMAGRDDDPHYEINSLRHKRTMPFRELVDLVTAPGPSNDVYLVANNHFFEGPQGRALLADVAPLPPFVDPTQLEGRCFLWFGPGGTKTPLHYDVVNVLFVQLYGRKTFRLASPDQHARMYNRVGVYSDIDLDHPDPERFPAFGDVQLFEVTLEPGDALFVPVTWWHEVRSVDASISVSISGFRLPNAYPYL
jgi:LPS sulfotransferase NodH